MVILVHYYKIEYGSISCRSAMFTLGFLKGSDYRVPKYLIYPAFVIKVLGSFAGPTG